MRPSHSPKGFLVTPATELIMLHPSFESKSGLKSCPMRGYDLVKLSIQRCHQCGIGFCTNSEIELSRMHAGWYKWAPCLPKATLAVGCEIFKPGATRRHVGQYLLRDPVSLRLMYVRLVERSMEGASIPKRLQKLLHDRSGQRFANSSSSANVGHHECTLSAARFVFDPPLDHQRELSLQPPRLDPANRSASLVLKKWTCSWQLSRGLGSSHVGSRSWMRWPLGCYTRGQRIHEW
mmetsp:Transcript_24545/g.77128  ORF Transcript_24545/g.77128 Transcript_24545/m.77128 type:complete len:235 (+) Transcript_24545:488-1192(+)